MMSPRQRVRLSKLMSYALRHNPAKFGLELDVNGWVRLDALTRALAQERGWDWLTADHVLHVVETSDKRRFEVEGPRLRARYGHSRAAKPRYRPVTPPALLYHGTARRYLPAIRQQGLKPMKRQYVHLSATPDMAAQVGHRRDEAPAILRIRAAEAHAEGIPFGTPSGGADNVYLVEAIPPEFIDFPE